VRLCLQTRPAWIDIEFNWQRRRFLTAAYTSLATVFSTNATDPLLTLSGHSQPLLSACWIGEEVQDSSSDYVATGGMDRVVRVWEVPSQGSSIDASELPKMLYRLSLHEKPVSSVRSSSDKRLLTAGWDGVIGYWELDEKYASEGGAEVGNADGRKKRRRTAANGEDGRKLVRALTVSSQYLIPPAHSTSPESGKSLARPYSDRVSGHL
jgi:ribosome biogenesis protein YTM1